MLGHMDKSPIITDGACLSLVNSHILSNPFMIQWAEKDFDGEGFTEIDGHFELRGVDGKIKRDTVHCVALNYYVYHIDGIDFCALDSTCWLSFLVFSSLTSFFVNISSPSVDY